MTYRVLEVEEWPLVEEEFQSRAVDMPDPRFAMIVAAFEDNSVLAGFLVVQLQFHTEPLVIKNPHCLSGLISTAENELRSRVGPCNYFAFADGKVAQIAELLGLEKVPMQIYKKHIE